MRHLLLATLLAFLAIPAHAGTFYQNGEVKTQHFNIEGGGSWNSAPFATIATYDGCMPMSHADWPEAPSTLADCTTGTTNRTAYRFPKDIHIIEWVWVTNLATNGSDDCGFQFSIDAGASQVGDELIIGSGDNETLAEGETVTGAMGVDLPAGQGLFLMVRETGADGACGSSLGRQLMHIRYVEAP